MRDLQAMSYAGKVAPVDSMQIQRLLSDSVLRWIKDGNSREIAMEWYQLGHTLCHRGASIDDVMDAVDSMRPAHMSPSDGGAQSWSGLRDFIKYYVIRGYQDGIR